jgi:hypothetical protein
MMILREPLASPQSRGNREASGGELTFAFDRARLAPKPRRIHLRLLQLFTLASARMGMRSRPRSQIPEGY